MALRQRNCGVFAVFFGLLVVPFAFQAALADHTVATIHIPAGSSSPGCEETHECFVPSLISIDTGGEVIWNNDDSAAHTVTSGTPENGPDGSFDSGLFSAGSTFSVKFEGFEAGNYPYFCMVHPWMTGTIVVEEQTEPDVVAVESVFIGDIDVTLSPPVEGSEDAPTTIIEFGDFQCPKCDQWFLNEKPKIESSYIDTGKTKLYFVDFPFLGKDSETAAEASYCANEQGKYWQYHHILYANQGEINSGWADVDALHKFATDIGLDMDEFSACLDSGKYSQRVSYNKEVGLSNGVAGTPVFFIVGPDGSVERIDGPQPFLTFAGIIDSMLGEASAEPLTDSEKQIDELSNNKKGGGCLIATAAFDSELAPQVQFLREIRDNTLLSTKSGTMFMNGFNDFYYSFSPTVADLERENPLFKETVKMLITPMMSSMSLMMYAEPGSESQVLGLGISIIVLNLGIYVAAPVAAGLTIRKHIKSK